jgi:asparagine synthase (glutamine-hydrolysing)
LLDKISYYYDEPFGDYSNFPTYEVSKLAREHVTVALSGDGGDEIFGGYTMHQAAARMLLIQKIPKFLRKAVLRLMPDLGGIGLYGQIREGFRLSLVRPENFYSELGSDMVYKPESYKKWSREKMKEMLHSCNNNILEAMIRYDLYYNTLADNFLVKVDRASMANALEVRAPFLDYRFLEFEAKIPSKWKTDFFHTKILMREIIKDILPKKIVYRGKQGFTPPLVEWVNKHDKEIRSGLEELHQKGIIDNKWHNFYKQSLKENNRAFQTYKIKLLLLWMWWKEWMPEKN